MVPSCHQSLIKAGSSVPLANAKMKCVQIKFKFGTDEYCLITKPSLPGGQDLCTAEVVRALLQSPELAQFYVHPRVWFAIHTAFHGLHSETRVWDERALPHRLPRTTAIHLGVDQK